MAEPGVPTLISPTDGASVNSPVTFVWEDSGGGDAPTGYVFMLDGTVVFTFTTPVTSVTIDLEPGLHTWSVAAVNAAGQSEFAVAWEVNVLYNTFLPLVFKH
jgi:hypothetical protein